MWGHSPCADVEGTAAASASPRRAQSTTRRCSPLCRARCWWGTGRCFWGPAGPGGPPSSPAPCLKEREGAPLHIYHSERAHKVPRLTDEGLPGLGVLALPPGVRPAHHHRVGFHAPQPAGLDHVADALSGLLRHDALTEALHALLLHQVLQSLRKQRGFRASEDSRNSCRTTESGAEPALLRETPQSSAGSSQKPRCRQWSGPSRPSAGWRTSADVET